MPFTFLVAVLAGWMNERQQSAVEFLREENRVLLPQLGKKRLRPTHDQRRHLAAKGQKLGRKMLSEMATIVTPDTILRRHRFGERSLTRAVREFEAHYNSERNYQGVGNRLLAPMALESGAVAHRERLGGLLNFYYRRAA